MEAKLKALQVTLPGLVAAAVLALVRTVLGTADKGTEVCFLRTSGRMMGETGALRGSGLVRCGVRGMQVGDMCTVRGSLVKRCRKR